MPIEEDIRKALEKFTFNKNLPEFIDRAKFLAGRLKEGEKLLAGLDKFGLTGPHYLTDHIYLDLNRREGRRQRVATIDCLGEIRYREDIFQDYKSLPESQRE